MLIVEFDLECCDSVAIVKHVRRGVTKKRAKQDVHNDHASSRERNPEVRCRVPYQRYRPCWLHLLRLFPLCPPYRRGHLTRKCQHGSR